jgi:putative transcription factor
MRCEVCGQKIRTDPTRALIEGAILSVCFECSKHGKKITDEEYDRKYNPVKTTPSLFSIKPRKKRKIVAKIEITQELVFDYASKIRQAREKLNLSHEKLGKRINEKASVLSKLETGKMTPNNMLVSKLEHTLKLSLLVPISKDKTPAVFSKSSNRELTMGDLIQFDKKSGEEPTERKQS